MRKVFFATLAILVASIFLVAQQNIIDLHRNVDKLTKKECLTCHSTITTDAPLNKKFKTFHRVHLESKLETPKDCADCHESVDLRERSASSLRKQVDPELCVGCHAGDVKGAKVLFAK